MAEATANGQERFRLVMDGGEVVEVDGTTVTDPDTGQQVASVLVRMPAWRATDLGEVLASWTGIADMFGRPSQPSLTEADLWWALAAAAAVAGDSRAQQTAQREPATVTSGRRATAIAVLRQRRPDLSMETSIAIIDAAAWWLTEPNGDAYAIALLTAISDTDTAETAHLVLNEGALPSA